MLGSYQRSEAQKMAHQVVLQVQAWRDHDHRIGQQFDTCLEGLMRTKILRMNGATRALAQHTTTKYFTMVTGMMSKIATMLLEECAITWRGRYRYHQWCRYTTLSSRQRHRLDQWLLWVGEYAAKQWLEWLQPKTLFQWKHPFQHL